MPKFIIIKESDNCATSLEDIQKGTEVKRGGNDILQINDEIPLGHKFALKDINRGEHVIKYNQIIGVSTMDIKKGDWIHTHNIKSAYLEDVKK